MPVLTQTADTITIEFDRSSGRQCGSCQACCKLLPVGEINKRAGERCRHQRVGKGCALYGQPDRPASCEMWVCRWLADKAATSGMKRPDRAHYVIDMMRDQIRARNDDQAEWQYVGVTQVWIDPAHPEAKDDPQLRAFIVREAEAGYPTLLRWSSTRATFVAAPPLTGGEWFEKISDCNPDIGLYSRLDPEDRPPL